MMTVEERKKALRDKISDVVNDSAQAMYDEKVSPGKFMKLIEDQKVELYEYVLRTTFLRPTTFKEKICVFFKYQLKGMLMYIPYYGFDAFLLWVGFLLVYPLTYWQCLGIFIILRCIKIGIINLKTDKHYDKPVSKPNP